MPIRIENEKNTEVDGRNSDGDSGSNNIGLKMCSWCPFPNDTGSDSAGVTYRTGFVLGSKK